MAKEIPKLTEMARHVIRDIHPMVCFNCNLIIIPRMT